MGLGAGLCGACNQGAGPFFEFGGGGAPLPWYQVAVEIHRQLDGRMSKLLLDVLDGFAGLKQR